MIGGALGVADKVAAAGAVGAMYWHHNNTNAINRAAKANNISNYGANYTGIRGGAGTLDYHNSAPNQKLVKIGKDQVKLQQD